MPSFQLCVCLDGTDSMASIVEMASRSATRARLIRNCCLRNLLAGLTDRTTCLLGLVEGANDGMILSLARGASITIDMAAALKLIATDDVRRMQSMYDIVALNRYRSTGLLSTR